MSMIQNWSTSLFCLRPVCGAARTVSRAACGAARHDFLHTVCSLRAAGRRCGMTSTFHRSTVRRDGACEIRPVLFLFKRDLWRVAWVEEREQNHHHQNTVTVIGDSLLALPLTNRHPARETAIKRLQACAPPGARGNRGGNAARPLPAPTDPDGTGFCQMKRESGDHSSVENRGGRRYVQASPPPEARGADRACGPIP